MPEPRSSGPAMPTSCASSLETMPTPLRAREEERVPLEHLLVLVDAPFDEIDRLAALLRPAVGNVVADRRPPGRSRTSRRAPTSASKRSRTSSRSRMQ